MLGELERNGRIVICDLEAGLGTVLRIEAEKTDLMVVVTEPTPKSIEVARRATEAAAQRADVLVVANRVRDDADVEAIRSALDGYDLVVVPEEPTIERADREGRAPIDVDPEAAGVAALLALADRLTA